MINAKEKETLRSRLADRSSTSGKKLTPEQREQLVRDFIEDPTLTIAEIARRYGIRPISARYLLHSRAR